ncbi:MAG: hypothetical protein M0P58_10560 [Bacteroidales bacterium]|nr:hypothetical protein [Bacteroidales bacterium]
MTFSCHQASSQEAVFMLPDSLATLLQQNSKSDMARVYALKKVVDVLLKEEKYEESLPFIKEISELSDNLNDNYSKALVNYYHGRYYYGKSKNKEAIQYLLSAQNIAVILRDNPTNKYLLLRIHKSLSACYGKCNMLPEAYQHVTKGLEINKNLGFTDDEYDLKNNLGLIYSLMNKPESAIELYKGILKDTLAFDALFNTGVMYSKLHNHDSTLLYFNLAYKNIRSSYDLPKVLNGIGITYLNKKDYKMGEMYLKKALSVPNVDTDMDCYLNIMINYAEVKFDLNKYDSALILSRSCKAKAKEYGVLMYQINCLWIEIRALDQLQLYDDIMPCLYEYNELKDSLYKIQDINMVNRLILQKEIKEIEERTKLELMKHQMIAEIKIKKQLIILCFIILFFVLATIIVSLLLNKKNIVLKNKKIHEQLLSDTLDLRNRELASKVLVQIQKKELIDEIINKLEVYTNISSNNTESIDTLIHNLKQTSKSNLRKDFDYYFVQIQPDFYNKLLADFPRLTQYELRLCAFIKLNLSSKDIAAINNLSLESVKSARKRLRKTLDITNLDDTLTSFLSKY